MNNNSLELSVNLGTHPLPAEFTGRDCIIHGLTFQYTIKNNILEIQLNPGSFVLSNVYYEFDKIQTVSLD